MRSALVLLLKQSVLWVHHLNDIRWAGIPVFCLECCHSPPRLLGKCLLIPQEAAPILCISCSSLPTPTRWWNCFLVCVFVLYHVALQIFVLSSSSMRLYSWEARILIMLNMINIHSFFVSIAPSKCEVRSSFMINVYCPVMSFCALDCVLHPSNGITYYYIYDICARQ